MRYRLPPEIKLNEFWPELVKFRQAKAELLPFQDQVGKPFWFVLTPKLQEHLHQVDSRGKDLLYSVVNRRRQMIYEAPPAHTVQPSMDALVNWITEGAQQPFIHPILRAALIHTSLVYAHPYVDGNGRTARAMFYWYLLKHRDEFFRYFSISSIMQETRERYDQSLKDMEDHEADVTYVLLYLAESVVRAIEVLLQRITERYRRDLLFATIRERRLLLNERQTRFVRSLTTSREKPGTIARHQKAFKVVYAQAGSPVCLYPQPQVLQGLTIYPVSG